MMNKKTAFVVDTPYQVMSAVSFATNHISQEEGQADLYLDTARCVNYDMQTLFDRLNNCGIFHQVIELKSLTSGQSGWKKKIFNYFEWLFPKTSIKMGVNGKVRIGNTKYDRVIVSGPFMLQRNFISFFPEAEVVFIEDGAGSYSGRVGTYALSKTGKMMQSFLHRGPEYVIPNKCYIYSPSYYEGEYKDRINKLLMAGYSDLTKLFDCESNQYIGARIVYLDQPPYASETNAGADEAVIDLLQNYYSGVVVRPHPQLKEREYKKLQVDRAGLQWEMICPKYITDESVLIGKYSTAQMTPKLLFDLEPTVIFTHRLYGIGPDSDFDKVIERFKRLYRDPERIIVCESMEELRIFLDEQIN